VIQADDGAAREATGDELDESTEAAVLPTTDPHWAELLQYLHVARGFDFQGYKPATLARRVRKRMGALGIDSFEAYQEYIELHQDEFRELFNTILINVTSFFRDPKRAATRSAPGARGAPAGRKPIPSPWCWPRNWVGSSSASG
jgi:hypothetical protein